jgi:hypothetical protein
MSKTQIPTGGIADDAVSEEHIDATVITGSTALAATPADTDELLISDAGTIKRIDYSLIKATNTPSFRVDLRSNQSITSGSETVIQFGNTVFDTASGWDSSNYEYTIPETGKWFIANVVRCSGGGNNTISAADVNLFEDSNMLAHFGLTPNTGSAMGIFASSTAGVYSLTQGDEIQVKATISASAPRVDARADGGFTHLSGFKLAE